LPQLPGGFADPVRTKSSSRAEISIGASLASQPKDKETQMNTTPLLSLVGALILTLLVANPSVMAAETECDDASVAKADELGCLPSPHDMSLDRLMAGTCCAENAAAECTQVELAAAEELMAAQLREVSSALRLGGDGDRLLASLHAAQVAWAGYREAQCTVMMSHEAGEPGEHAALRERCRFEFTVERILDLAEMQEKLEASGPRLVQLH
jgi:uncharacterized protein YecT (DUF1311 family)